MEGRRRCIGWESSEGSNGGLYGFFVVVTIVLVQQSGGAKSAGRGARGCSC